MLFKGAALLVRHNSVWMLLGFDPEKQRVRPESELHVLDFAGEIVPINSHPSNNENQESRQQAHGSLTRFTVGVYLFWL